MIKTIIFDLNKVLITHENIDLDDEYRKYFGMTQKAFWDVGKKIFYTYNNPDEVKLETFLGQILDHFHFDIALLSVLKDLYERAFSLVEGIEDILITLKKRHVLILLAGDGKESFKYKTEQFHLNRFFIYMYCSADFKMRKTKKEIYQSLLRKHDLLPDETLFIDDLKIHTKTARLAGLQTIHFKNISQLKKDLNNLGLLGSLTP